MDEDDLYADGCPTRQLLDRVGDRWTMLTIGALTDGPRRYGYLAERVQGISQKMLTQTLHALERDGFVTRTAFRELPRRVEYELTHLGHSLLDVVLPMSAWAIAHMGPVQDARHNFDLRNT